MNRYEAQLLSNEPEGADATVLTFQIQRLAAPPQPGQFFMVKLLVGGFPLFGRALAVLDYDEASGPPRIRFMVKAVGQGTELMCMAEPGTQALLVGPAGNAFPALDRDRPYLFVAGGTGVAAFYYWFHSSDRADDGNDGNRLLLYGARNRSCLYLHERIQELPIDMRISTDDGSLGDKGFVTGLLSNEFDSPDFSPRTEVLACGPDPMMKAVAALCREKQVPLHLSLEVRMACGFGVCNGCAVEVVMNGQRTFQRVCHDGPVFPAHLLPSFWDPV